MASPFRTREAKPFPVLPYRLMNIALKFPPKYHKLGEIISYQKSNTRSSDPPAGGPSMLRKPLV
jgi:hypothetical protein